MKRRKFIKLGSFAGVSTIIGMSGLKAVESFSASLANTERMPVLFLGHGSPMNAIEENQFVAGFRKVAKSIPLPKAIICISAHWFTKGTQVTAMEMPKTIHDFRGFPDELNNFQYPAPGNPDLAKELKNIVQPVHADLDQDWGLDHGAWSVITHLYPNANIPVIQMSIDYTKPAQYHFELAAQLNSLRDKGILIIGSGNIVHNLRMVDFSKMNQDDYGYDWAVEARNFVNDKLLNGDYQSLFNYQNQGEALNLAVPTPDHYLPLIYTLGLKQKHDGIDLFNDKMVAGSISMTSLKIG